MVSVWVTLSGTGLTWPPETVSATTICWEQVMDELAGGAKNELLKEEAGGGGRAGGEVESP